MCNHGGCWDGFICEAWAISVRVPLEDFLRFRYRLVGALSFPVYFRQPLTDYRRFRIQRIRFLVRLDRLRGVFRAAGRLVLLLVDVAHREVVIGLGPCGLLCGGGVLRVDKSPLWRGEWIRRILGRRGLRRLRR